MTIMVDREVEAEVEVEPDFVVEDDLDLDLDLGGLMYGCADGGEHTDAYTVFSDSYSVSMKCDGCGDTWTEDLD